MEAFGVFDRIQLSQEDDINLCHSKEKSLNMVIHVSKSQQKVHSHYSSTNGSKETRLKFCLYTIMYTQCFILIVCIQSKIELCRKAGLSGYPTKYLRHRTT